MYTKTKTKNQKTGIAAVFSTVGIVALFGAQILIGNIPVAEAAGVTPTITPDTSDVATAASVDIAFTTSADLNIGDTIQLYYPNTYTGTLSTANTTVNTVAPSAVTNTTVGSEIQSTITLANAITTGNTVTISTSALTTPVAAGNYAFKVITPADFGGNFQYVGEDNVVEVRAFVPLSLSFAIRDTADTADTNICDMGTVTSAAVGECSYRLKVGTNAENGYIVSVNTTGDFTNGSHNATNATAGATGTDIVAGTETYGAILDEGAVTSGSGITVATAYDAGANEVEYVNTTAANLLTAAGPNNPAVSADTTNTSLITHRFGVSDVTPAGLYLQEVTYTVSPSF
jgi:hypothetical protein